MKLYSGIDLHSNNSMVTVIDEDDRVVFERRLGNDLERIRTALEPYSGALEGVVVESTFNWYWLVDGLAEAGYTVHLANTTAIQQYDGLKYTDDAHDARWLAHLLRLGLLKEGYICPKELRAVRDLMRNRGKLVQHRSREILSVENLVARHTGRTMRVKEVRQLKLEQLPYLLGSAEAGLEAMTHLMVMRTLDGQIQVVEQAVRARVKLREPYLALESIPGIGPVLATTIMLETGEIGRFRHVGQFASYCRCVASKRLSNGKKKGEGNAKNGNRYLAWAFVEAAHFALRANERIRRFYQRKKAKRNGAVATKAVAHKLARAAYYVMRDRVAFDIDKAFA